MESHKQECLSFIQDFKNGEITLDWASIFAHEDYLNNLNDSITNLIYHVSLTKSIDQAGKMAILGQLVIQQAELAHAVTFKKEAAFIKAGSALEQTLKKLVETGSWLKEAEQKFDVLEKLQEPIEKGTITEQQTNDILPVLILLEIASAINCEEEASDEDECCD